MSHPPAEDSHFVLSLLNDFEQGIWFKYKACSFDSSGGVLLYVEHWAKLRNVVIGLNNRSNT